ncbi:tyrosine--tRNA ligase, partial [Candidatus Curtissbacteria bacterium]|nr:tyrosine--tRNA ligase [Candidatus Curtissbacteria bacterium]
MDVDVEIGGTDQLFNMMMGRHLMHKMKRKNKFVMTTKLLTDAQGNKIGKTEGNTTALIAPPDQIFGAIMSFPDETIVTGLEYLTNVPMEEIQQIQKSIKPGQNSLQFKKRLAFEVVKQLNGQQAAEKAQKDFENIFQKGQKPEEIETVKIDNSSQDLVEFLSKHNLAASKSAAKRLLEQGAIEIDGVTTKKAQVEFKEGQVVKIGKRKFVKILIE